MKSDPFKPAPIYLGIAIWGQEFCQHFLNNCLASLLEAGNIPFLPNYDKNKFLFCTTIQDWEWLQSQPLFTLLSKYIKPEFMPIKMSFDGQTDNSVIAEKFQIVTRAHADILDRMHQDKTIGSIIFPDTLYAENCFKNIYSHILNEGKKVVVACVPRLSTPSLLLTLAEQHWIKKDSPINIPNRILLHNALTHMNTEVLAQNWNSLYAFDFITDVWMPYKKHPCDGIVTHSFAWCPILIDYTKLASHNIKCLENNTIDGAYLYSNFKIEDFYVVTDSDEFLMISYSPHTRLRIRHKIQYANRRISNLKKIAHWRKMIELSLGGFVDPLKLELLKYPIMLHTTDIDKDALKIKNYSNQIVDYILNNPFWKEKLLEKFYYNRWINKLSGLRRKQRKKEHSIIDDLIMSHAI